jgi:hypothetical protein
MLLVLAFALGQAGSAQSIYPLLPSNAGVCCNLLVTRELEGFLGVRRDRPRAGDGAAGAARGGGRGRDVGQEVEDIVAAVSW